MHKYIIMGAQGSGKGTQAKLLKDKFDLIHISVGDIFRWNIQSHTKLAAKIKRIVSSGALVPDEIVEEVVKDRLDQHDWNFGFILDGFPRNHHQAMFFLESYDIDAVIHIHVPDEVVMERIMSRRLCQKCGLDYNLIFHRPAVEDTCDVCKGKLIQRVDDQPKAIADRLADYHAKTHPVLDLFRKKELVLDVDGTRSAEDVHTEVMSKLNTSVHCLNPTQRGKCSLSTVTVK